MFNGDMNQLMDETESQANAYSAAKKNMDN